MIDPSAIDYCLWFYPNINRFVDDKCTIIHDLLPYFQIWQIEEWKKNKKYEILKDRFDNKWELYYLEEEDEEYLCNHRCLWCPLDCDIRKLWDKWEQEQYLIKGE